MRLTRRVEAYCDAILVRNSLDEDRHDVGTYVAVRYSHKVERTIAEWCGLNRIKHPIDVNDIHTTIAYSKVALPDYCQLGTCKPPVRIDATDYRFDIFGPPDDRVLVLKFKSLWLTSRFDYAMSLGATWKWDSYEPHVTLATKIRPGFRIDRLMPLAPTFFVREEYKEPLKASWNKDAAA